MTRNEAQTLYQNLLDLFKENISNHDTFFDSENEIEEFNINYIKSTISKLGKDVEVISSEKEAPTSKILYGTLFFTMFVVVKVKIDGVIFQFDTLISRTDHENVDNRWNYTYPLPVCDNVESKFDE